ncbi:MAG: polyphosphate polymerase domain-containing protein [Eubacteriales bacterium]
MIFERTEKKYLLTESDRAALLEAAAGRLVGDVFPHSEVSSLYMDTPDRRVIRRSIDADCYKEKLRLRAYGTPALSSPVFVELKKKYRGIVYKRREQMTLAQAYRFLENGIPPFSSQILSEIAYMIRQNEGIAPAACIFYERDAYAGRMDDGLRVTFDRSVLFRDDELRLERGAHGRPVLAPGMCIMEIKSPGAMPLWLAGALDGLRLYPSSFSKYGTAYTKYETASAPAENSDIQEALHA